MDNNNHKQTEHRISVLETQMKQVLHLLNNDVHELKHDLCVFKKETREVLHRALLENAKKIPQIYWVAIITLTNILTGIIIYLLIG